MRVWYGCRVLMCALSLLLSGAHASARVLESPADGALVSGLRFLSGWKCNAGQITVTLDGGRPILVATEQPRADTLPACGTIQNGFIAQTNWHHLGAGLHTAVAYDDGVEFARSTFTVGTTATEFLQGVKADCRVADFPTPGSNGRFAWNASTQHLELAEAGAHVRLVASGNAAETSVEQWAQEWVDLCYRKADAMAGERFKYYDDALWACLNNAQEVGWRRMWRDRHVRDLVRAITEVGSLEEWFLAWQLDDDCHPDGDINRDLQGNCEKNQQHWSGQ